MSSVTGTYSVTVNPAVVQNPLTLTPTSGTEAAETEGVADPGENIATVSGGVRPYSYTVAGVPPGMALNAVTSPDGTTDTLVLSGAPTAGDAANSPFTISVTVTDSAPAAAKASAKIG